MKTRILFVLFAAAFLVADCLPEKPPSTPSTRPPFCQGLSPDACAARTEAVGRAVRGTVVVRSYSDSSSGAYSSGTGFILDDSGHVLTAEHVISGAQNVYVFPREMDEMGGHFISASVAVRIVAVSDEHDAALLAPLEGEILPPPIAWDAAPLARRDAVWQVGKKTLWAWGTVRRVYCGHRGPTHGLIHADLAVAHGDSGGPLLDAAGRARGLLARMDPDGEESYFVPLAVALEAVGYEG